MNAVFSATPLNDTPDLSAAFEGQQTTCSTGDVGDVGFISFREDLSDVRELHHSWEQDDFCSAPTNQAPANSWEGEDFCSPAEALHPDPHFAATAEAQADRPSVFSHFANNTSDVAESAQLAQRKYDILVERGGRTAPTDPTANMAQLVQQMVAQQAQNPTGEGNSTMQLLKLMQLEQLVSTLEENKPAPKRKSAEDDRKAPPVRSGEMACRKIEFSEADIKHRAKKRSLYTRANRFRIGAMAACFMIAAITYKVVTYFPDNIAHGHKHDAPFGVDTQAELEAVREAEAQRIVDEALSDNEDKPAFTYGGQGDDQS